jgi:hypothetical protein
MSCSSANSVTLFLGGRKCRGVLATPARSLGPPTDLTTIICRFRCPHLSEGGSGGQTSFSARTHDHSLDAQERACVTTGRARPPDAAESGDQQAGAVCDEPASSCVCHDPGPGARQSDLLWWGALSMLVERDHRTLVPLTDQPCPHCDTQMRESVATELWKGYGSTTRSWGRGRRRCLACGLTSRQVCGQRSPADSEGGSVWRWRRSWA